VCHASLGPAYLSDGPPHCPHPFVRLRSPVLLRRARRGVQLVNRARERGGNFSNNSQRERAIEVGFGSERFEQPLQTQDVPV
jgi:hypothetical protein